MIVIDHTIVSDDLKESYFTCDLNRCKGACCVEGDLGAPLEDRELEIMEKIYPQVAPILSEEGNKAIREQGNYIRDREGDFSTPTVGGKECAYAIYEQGVLRCGIEKAYELGKIDFQKPISCHLYPVRIRSYQEFEAVNYDRWHICNPACKLGKTLQKPLYQFLKAPLIRKYGRDWFRALEQAVTEPVKDPPDQNSP